MLLQFFLCEEAVLSFAFFATQIRAQIIMLAVVVHFSFLLRFENNFAVSAGIREQIQQRFLPDFNNLHWNFVEFQDGL